MKVCFVFSTSEITGGANKSALEFIRLLDRNVVEPIALIKKHGDIENELKKLDIPTEIIPFINNVSTKRPFLDYLKIIQERLTTKKVEKFLLNKKIDIVHNNSLPALAGMEAAYNLEIPYVCHIREQVENGLGLHFLNKNKHLKIASHASKIIAVSEFVCKEYDDQLNGAQIEVIHDGIDVSLYLNEDKTILTDEYINLGIYGNLDEQKGQMDAVRALKELQNRGHDKICLHIVGNQKTEYGNILRDYINSKKMSDVYLSDPIRDIYELRQSRSMIDIALICSSAEGLGRVTVESMLTGCLTIGAKAGATPEIIRDGENGLLYECRNATDLADKIEWVINNREIARRIAEKGRKETTKKFDIDAYARRIQDIYEHELYGE